MIMMTLGERVVVILNWAEEKNCFIFYIFALLSFHLLHMSRLYAPVIEAARVER